MSTQHAAAPAAPRGYLLADSTPHVVSAEELCAGPIPVPGGADETSGGARLHPAIAVLLTDVLPPDAGSGVVTRAIGAAFVAARVVDPGTGGSRFTLADCPVPIPLPGPVCLWSGAAGPEVYHPADFGDLTGRIGALATEVGTLAAGQLVVLGPLAPRAGLPARPGTVQLWGPADSALIVVVARRPNAGTGR